jgi:hypothetical protein
MEPENRRAGRTAAESDLDDLRRYEPMHQFITLACISNPVGGDLIGTTRDRGQPAKAAAGPAAQAGAASEDPLRGRLLRDRTAGNHRPTNE